MKKPFEYCRDEDLRGSLNALLRAARKAQNTAYAQRGIITRANEALEVSMNTKELIDTALKLPPDERFALIDELLHSLDRPDPDLDRIWIEEAERRLAAYRSGRVRGIPAEDVVGPF
ncbi:addiction module protein [Immundisolibacter cernigliae]|nr:addiction module protein [Immundisolibacter cernigliae]